MKVKFKEPVKLHATRYEPGDVVDVSDDDGTMLIGQSLAEGASAEVKATKAAPTKTAKKKS